MSTIQGNYGNIQYPNSLSPDASIKVLNPSNDLQSIELAAILDTAAVMTCLPEQEIKKLGILNYGSVNIRDVNNNIRQRKTYIVDIQLGDDKFSDVEVIATSQSYGLIGRDILNHHKKIDEMNTAAKGNKAASEKETKLKIILVINKLLMILFITSFIFIFIYSLMYPYKPILDLIQNVFFTILGWFGGILGIRFYIDDMNTVEKGNKQASENETKLIIFTQINRLLMIVCIASFIFIIIYSLMYPDKPIPDLMQNAFFTTLGWFGGILGAFFQVDQNK